MTPVACGASLRDGTATSHVSIIARALGIPVVGKVDGVMRNVDTGDRIIVDGDNAQVFVRPSEDIEAHMTETLRAREQRRSRYASMRGLKTVTRDHVDISLNINCGILADMQWLEETGADGVGLYRTEIPFMVRSSFPIWHSRPEFIVRCWSGRTANRFISGPRYRRR